MADAQESGDSGEQSLTLEMVMENRDFYVVEKGRFRKKRAMNAEVQRLGRGIHLIRCELFRLRAAAAGVSDETIECELPRFVNPVADDFVLKAIHAMLRQRVEYLRADLIVAGASARQ